MGSFRVIVEFEDKELAEKFAESLETYGNVIVDEDGTEIPATFIELTPTEEGVNV